MIDKETELNKELGKPIKKFNEQEHKIVKQIDHMLAYGSANLGLNSVKKESYSEERIIEDLEK